MEYKNFKKHVDEMNKSIAKKLKDNEKELTFYYHLVFKFNEICEENNRLKLACNDTYESYQDICGELTKENEKLKKQLEDMTDCRDIASGHRKEVQDRETILLNQQKEFITYLTSYIELLKNKPDLIEEGQAEILKEILQKYLEIIGVSDK